MEPPNDKEIIFPGVSNTQEAKKAGDACTQQNARGIIVHTERQRQTVAKTRSPEAGQSWALKSTWA